MALQLLTADEKITELQQIVEHYGYENEQLKSGIERMGNDKIIIQREKLDELVQKEVQNKMGMMGRQNDNSQFMEREL